MAITWKNGTGGYTSLGSPIVLDITPTAGDCLVLSVGMYVTNDVFYGIGAGVSDNQGNVWALVATSPIQYETTSGFQAAQLYTFVALNVVGAATTITVANGCVYIAATLDEYSGAASVNAVDGITFNSTTYPAGPSSSVSSLPITINGAELVYSAAFADSVSGDTLTPSAGFTARQNPTSPNVTLTSFDKAYSGGTATNTITAGTAANTLHVNLIALSPTPISSLLAQPLVYYASHAILQPTISVPYLLPNQSGNLLILVARANDRDDYIITDTLGNTWSIVTVGSPPSVVIGYCANAKQGANTVTVNGQTGGSDQSWSVILAEYSIQQAAFISSSSNITSPDGSSVNTGNVATSGLALLISVMVSGGGAVTYQAMSPVGTNPGVWRGQFSDPGLFDDSGADVVLSDQMVDTAGEYSNTFTAPNSIDELFAAILGFSIRPIALACPTNSGAMLGQFYSGQLLVINGAPPFTFAIISGGLPAGITLNTSSGLISGTPTTAGSYPYEAQVTDSLGNMATANCIITIPNSGLSSGAMASCGCLPSVEVTRDIDADWGDQDTFYITQDQPFPFTLRGIVLRMSYEND